MSEAKQMSESAYFFTPTGDWDECYSMLIGPNGFECLMTEPEDRTWTRDGKAVVDELNRLHEENRKLRSALDKSPVPDKQGVAFGDCWVSYDRIVGWDGDADGKRERFYATDTIAIGILRWRDSYIDAISAAEPAGEGG